MRLLFVFVVLAGLLSGCGAPPPLKAQKTELRSMSSETKQSIAENSKEADTAAKETTFEGKK